MAFEDFNSYFTYFVVCEYVNDYEFTWKKIDRANQYNLIEIDIKKDGDYTFSQS